MITARFAADLGNELGAVPGPVTSRTSDGPNVLLADGAVLVRHAHDVIEAMPSSGTSGNPGLLRRSAAALIAEDRVPSEVLADLVDTYQPQEEPSCD